MPRTRLGVLIPTGIIGGGAVTYTISGTVYDADGTTAVSGATITLGALEATSGADGTYSFTGLAAGTSGSMTCTKTGYSWTAITVAAMSGNLTSQNYTNAWWAAGGLSASCTAAYQALGAASQAISYKNLTDIATHELSVGTAPGWAAATGWTFDGTQYLITDITPPNNQAFTAIVRFSGATITGGIHALVGWLSGGRGFSVRCWDPTANGVAYINGGTTIVAPGLAGGVLALAGGNGYRDGVDEADIAASDGAKGAMYVGGENNFGHNQVYIGNMQGIAFYGSALTSPQVAAISSALAAVTNP